MSTLDPTVDVPQRITNVERILSLMNNTLEALVEQVRLQREDANNGDGANRLAESLEVLTTTVQEQPAKLLDAAQTIADTAARKTLSEIPC